MTKAALPLHFTFDTLDPRSTSRALCGAYGYGDDGYFVVRREDVTCLNCRKDLIRRKFKMPLLLRAPIRVSFHDRLRDYFEATSR
jgi:hypothetical protein